MHPSIARLAPAAAELGVTVGEEALRIFDRYLREILAWQSRVNLVAARDPAQIVSLHFVDSLLALSVSSFQRQSTVVDVGSGAGFPGIPLKIVRPDLKVTLVEASRRRAAFLEHVRSTLRFDDMVVVWGRAEELGHTGDMRERFVHSVERATAPLAAAAELCLPFVRPGGAAVFLKGPGVERQLAEAASLIHVLRGSVVTKEIRPLPMTDRRRAAVVIAKTDHTPRGYPRKPPSLGTPP